MLDDVIHTERYREILETLTPHQFLVVFLKLEFEMTNSDVARILGLERSAIGQRMWHAQGRVLRRFPELKPCVKSKTR